MALFFIFNKEFMLQMTAGYYLGFRRGLQRLSVQGFLYHKAGLSLVPGPSFSCSLQEAGPSAGPDHPTLSCVQGPLLASCDDLSRCLAALSPRRQMNLAWNQGPQLSSSGFSV